ncbi:MAG: hypothetical protein CL816_00140 [Coxiellaceae bacterium]|nr:hypothetical protein [Coxiellaceae bacterium]|tara:strand:+ start:10205 stop:10882 length:678 start_codon:yes stop_codon:yes gene_type:complete
MTPVPDWLPKDLHQTKAINELAGCAAPLLTIAYQLTQQVEPLDDTFSLIEVALEEAKLFYKKAHNLGYYAQQILSARYWLCSTLDELILGLPNPNKTLYPSLLKSLNHSSNNHFYSILDQQRLSPSPSADVLEIAYLCLCLNTSNQNESYRANTPEALQEKLLKQILNIRTKIKIRTVSPTKKITQFIIIGLSILTLLLIMVTHQHFQKKLKPFNQILSEITPNN